jgi:hypothetical protein
MRPEGSAANPAPDTDIDRDSFLSTLEARPYRVRSKWSWYPRIKPEDARECLEFLGREWEPHAKEYEEELRGYRAATLVLSGWPGVVPAVFCIGLFSAFIPIPGESPSPWSNGFLLVALYAAMRSLLSVTSFGARMKFFRRAFFVDVYTREFEPQEYNQAFVRCMNEAGRGARFLFRYIQRRRWTWTSPPVVSDRALMLTYPIIHLDLYAEPLELSAGDFLAAYPRFYRDVTILVAIGREDLIPTLRRRYPVFPAARASQPTEVPERDVRFLDPARDHSRWQFTKDYLLPLASWFSLAVAIAALVVNQLR